MIYSVTEWWGNNINRYFFDSDKVSFNISFEVAYLQCLIKAAQEPNKTLNLAAEINKYRFVIHERTTRYFDKIPEWEKLLVHLPCRVDLEVELIMSEV